MITFQIAWDCWCIIWFTFTAILTFWLAVIPNRKTSKHGWTEFCCSGAFIASIYVVVANIIDLWVHH